MANMSSKARRATKVAKAMLKLVQGVSGIPVTGFSSESEAEHKSGIKLTGET